MSTFIELNAHIEDQRWENRAINMDYCIRIVEHDATERFKQSPKAEPFQSNLSPSGYGLPRWRCFKAIGAFFVTRHP